MKNNIGFILAAISLYDKIKAIYFEYFFNNSNNKFDIDYLKKRIASFNKTAILFLRSIF